MAVKNFLFDLLLHKLEWDKVRLNIHKKLLSEIAVVAVARYGLYMCL